MLFFFFACFLSFNVHKGEEMWGPVPPLKTVTLAFFFVVVVVSFSSQRTRSRNKLVAIRCHRVSQHEIIEECNYHFAQQSFLWNEMWANNWEEGSAENEWLLTNLRFMMNQKLTRLSRVSLHFNHCVLHFLWQTLSKIRSLNTNSWGIYSNLF